VSKEDAGGKSAPASYQLVTFRERHRMSAPPIAGLGRAVGGRAGFVIIIPA
jgi:hypothetical protein